MSLLAAGWAYQPEQGGDSFVLQPDQGGDSFVVLFAGQGTVCWPGVVLMLPQQLGHIVRPDKQHRSQTIGLKMSAMLSRICWVWDLVMFNIATFT